MVSSANSAAAGPRSKRDVNLALFKVYLRKKGGVPYCKESWPRGPGIGLPPGRGLSMTLFCSKYLWSVGVMEYWKNENPTPIFCNLKQRASRFSDA
jgi:hypothetical protein